MSRHERDAVSLMAGVLLVLVGGLFLVDDLTTLRLDGRWTAPVVLIAVGLAGVLATLRAHGTADPEHDRQAPPKDAEPARPAP